MSPKNPSPVKSRAEKNNSHSICPSNAIRANETNTQTKHLIRTIPGNQSYASTTKHGIKMYRGQ